MIESISRVSRHGDMVKIKKTDPWDDYQLCIVEKLNEIIDHLNSKTPKKELEPIPCRHCRGTGLVENE